MKRFFLSTFIPLVAVLVLTTHVQALALWCKSDPVVTLNGTVVDITVAIPLEYVPLVNGPVYYEIQTPRGTARELILSDVGYNGHGAIVAFTDGGGAVTNNQIPTRVRATVPVDESQLAPGERVPAELTALVDNGQMAVAQGTSGRIEIELSVPGR